MNPAAEQVRQMSDDQLRIKIAEALGAEWVQHPTYAILFDVCGFAIAERTAGRIVTPIKNSGSKNWPADLNAAAELTQHAQSNGVMFDLCNAQYGDGHWDYECTLFDGISINCRQYTAAAPTEARARAEAWYLWKLEAK